MSLERPIVEGAAVTVLVDPFFSLRALAKPGPSGVSVRRLRELLDHPEHPLPHYRLGDLDRLAGRRGAAILVKWSEFMAWMQRWRVHQEAPPQDLGGILAQAVAEVKGRPGRRRRR